VSSTTGPSDGQLKVAFADDGGAVRIKLRGQADAASTEVLQNALAGLTVDGARRVELDVSALEFIDIAALRHLTLFAMQLQESGREVRTRGAQPVLAHLIRLVGAHDKLGLDGAADG
jgi:anti-anti-sigma factor